MSERVRAERMWSELHVRGVERVRKVREVKEGLSFIEWGSRNTILTVGAALGYAV